LAAPPAFPWVYPYTEERRVDGAEFLLKALLRPLVIVRFEGERLGSHNVVALVDSGADHILVSPWIAQDIGVTPDPNRSIMSRIGGATRPVQFADVRVILAPPDIEIDAGGFDRGRCYEWEAQVGFFTTWQSPPWSVVLGQIGFFDRFTVTMNRQSQALAITAVEDFDDRYPQPPRAAQLPPTRRPRLLPP
jgi:Aspartyl protease